MSLGPASGPTPLLSGERPARPGRTPRIPPSGAGTRPFAQEAQWTGG